MYKDLKRKDRNTDVKNLQEKLIELGYLDDTADGIFGEKTQVAIEQLQSDLGMTVTGVATASACCSRAKCPPIIPICR